MFSLSDIGDAISDGVDALKDGATAAYEAGKEAAEDALDSAEEALDDVKDSFDDALTDIGTAFEDTWGDFKNVWNNANDPLDLLAGLGMAIVAGTIRVSGAIASGIGRVAGSTVSAGLRLLGAALEAGMTAVGIIVGMVGGALLGILTVGFVLLGEDVSSFDLGKFIVDTINGFQQLGKVLNDAAGKLADIAETINNMGSDILNGLSKNAAGLVMNVFKFAHCQWRSVKSFVKEMLGGPHVDYSQFKQKFDYVFVLMLENRSYDHLFAFHNSNENNLPGQFNIFNDARHSLTNDAPDRVDHDPPHEYLDIKLQVCGRNQNGQLGNYLPNVPTPNSGFVESYSSVSLNPGSIMQCFNDNSLPVFTRLANDYALCSRWFSSLPGPTWPNRFFVHAATSGGLADSPVTTSDIFTVKKDKLEAATSGIDPFTFKNGTIYDRLDYACIPWKIYSDDALPQVLALSSVLTRLYQRASDEILFGGIDSFERDLSLGAVAKYNFIEPSYDNSHHNKGGNSMHPIGKASSAEELVERVYKAIRNSPVWEKSLLIITFDEHGGFYDRMSLPDAVAPGDDRRHSRYNQSQEANNFDYKKLGVRVPAIVVSPFIERGTIDETVYDHTSILKTVEKRFNLKPLTDRDSTANSLEHLLTRAQPRQDI